jgi:hypothetical protein
MNDDPGMAALGCFLSVIVFLIAVIVVLALIGLARDMFAWAFFG